MQDKDKSLDDIQEAINKKVEAFMGGPPPEEDEKPREPSSKTKKAKQEPLKASQDVPGPPPVPVGATGEMPHVPETLPPKPSSIDSAVDDIAAKESDALMAAEDAEVSKAFGQPQHVSFLTRIRTAVRAFWNSKKLRWATILSAFLIAGSAMAYPASRYFVMNTVGLRATSTVTVLDESTKLPLKNVEVTLAGAVGATDQDGNVTLSHVRMGKTELTITKRAFAPQTKPVTIGFGSNPLGSFSLTPTGSQYSFRVQDWLSGKPVVKAEATSGYASAISDTNGVILLTLEKPADQDEISVDIAASGYRTESIKIPADTTAQKTINMVPARKEVFISKESGKYDLYKVDADGTNQQLVLKGTGYERSDMVLVPHPTDEVVAYVSTRDNARDNDDFLLSTLNIIDLTSNAVVSVEQSQRIQIIGWSGSRIVYVAIAAGASAADPSRNRLVSYDYKTKDKKELAHSNAFNDVVAAGGHIYYATSDYYKKQPNAQLYQVDADGQNQKTVLNQETWNIFRVGYSEFNLSAQKAWYDYKLDTGELAKLSGQPSELANRLYIDSPDGKQSLWVDKRDGKGALMLYDLSTSQDKTLQTQGGLSYPVRWLNNTTVIYRVQTSGETADYAMNVATGQTRKIIDVTNTAGLTDWYYY